MPIDNPTPESFQGRCNILSDDDDLPLASPEPADGHSPADVDHHSSEEELECINSAPHRLLDAGSRSSRSTSSSSFSCGEKRKYSRASSASSEDEDTMKTTHAAVDGRRSHAAPVEFHSLPPAHAYRPQSYAFVVVDFTSSDPGDAGVEADGDGDDEESFTQPRLDREREKDRLPNGAGSPRKRHRHFHRVPRPCLDFEKMQQVRRRLFILLTSTAY